MYLLNKFFFLNKRMKGKKRTSNILTNGLLLSKIAKKKAFAQKNFFFLMCVINYRQKLIKKNRRNF